MARLLVPREPLFTSRHLFYLAPLLALQAGTLAGLAYFYNRSQPGYEPNVEPVAPPPPVSSMPDSHPSSFPVRTADSLPLSAPVVITSLGAPPVVVEKPQQGVVLRGTPDSFASMGIGQDFAVVAEDHPHKTLSAGKISETVNKPVTPVKKSKVSPVKQEAAPAAKKDSEKGKEKKALNTVAKPVVTKKHGRSDRPARSAHAAVRARAANRAGLERSPRAMPDTVAIPSSGGRWIYLGQLRESGWHGPQLYKMGGSLPQVGQVYSTQQVHGTYSAPHGKRSMGGFQQGDAVRVDKVSLDPNGDAWARVGLVGEVGKRSVR